LIALLSRIQFRKSASPLSFSLAHDSRLLEDESSPLLLKVCIDPLESSSTLLPSSLLLPTRVPSTRVAIACSCVRFLRVPLLLGELVGLGKRKPRELRRVHQELRRWEWEWSERMNTGSKESGVG